VQAAVRGCRCSLCLVFETLRLDSCIICGHLIRRSGRGPHLLKCGGKGTRMRRILLLLVLTVGSAVALIKRLGGLGDAEAVGLGDVIKRATNAIGLQTCAGCAHRASTLNRWLPLSNPSRREWLRLASGVRKSTPRNPLGRLFLGSLDYGVHSCTPDGRACVCRSMYDCLIMGKEGKCRGKRKLCTPSACICF